MIAGKGIESGLRQGRPGGGTQMWQMEIESRLAGIGRQHEAGGQVRPIGGEVTTARRMQHLDRAQE